MCGIVGMISRRQVGFLHADLDLMENLLVLDTLRGLDSTGLYTINRNRSVNIIKVASHPHHLFACDDWGKYRSSAVNNGRIVMGHNRKATQGKVNSDNAHPFHENNIVLIHNGTLRGDHKKMADVEVDSHAVCHAFNEKGAEEVLPTIDGAFAFVWWDIAKGKLFAIRNEERPLHIIKTDSLILFASEPWMAIGLLGRTGTKIESVESLEEGVLYEFDTTGTYTTKPIKLLERPVYGTTTYYSSGACNSGKPVGGALAVIKDTNSGSKTTSVTTTDSAPPEPNMAQFRENPLFPKGDTVLCKLNEFKLSDDAKHYRITGRVTEPGRPEIDVVCHVSVGLAGVKGLSGNIPAFMENYVTAEILAYTESLCGGSIFVKNLAIAPETKLHMVNVPTKVWDYVVTNCKCSTCTAKIYDEEAPFTSVSQRATGDLRVICADCVEDKLIGEYKNEFQQRRNDALQNDLAVSPQSGNVIVLPTAGNGTPTVH